MIGVDNMNVPENITMLLVITGFLYTFHVSTHKFLLARCQMSVSFFLQQINPSWIFTIEPQVYQKILSTNLLVEHRPSM